MSEKEIDVTFNLLREEEILSLLQKKLEQINSIGLVINNEKVTLTKKYQMSLHNYISRLTNKIQVDLDLIDSQLKDIKKENKIVSEFPE